jgi:hypothetical protein
MTQTEPNFPSGFIWKLGIGAYLEFDHWNF